jgi:hypothetical protein
MLLTRAKNWNSYPMVTVEGIKELVFLNGEYFNELGINVTHLVSFVTIYERSRFTI